MVCTGVVECDVPSSGAEMRHQPTRGHWRWLLLCVRHSEVMCLDTVRVRIVDLECQEWWMYEGRSLSKGQALPQKV